MPFNCREEFGKIKEVDKEFFVGWLCFGCQLDTKSELSVRKLCIQVWSLEEMLGLKHKYECHEDICYI